MNKKQNYSSTVRKEQEAATRDLIIRSTIALLNGALPGRLSHEAVAAKAGVASRTVYRHFRTQGDLARAAWARFVEEAHIRFPATEAELAELPSRAFRHFDKYESLVRAFLAFDVGAKKKEDGDVGGRAQTMRALSRLTTGLTPPERARVVAVFVALCSASMWRVMRDEGQLSGQETAKAVEWAVQALAAALARKPLAGRTTGRGTPSATA